MYNGGQGYRVNQISSSSYTATNNTLYTSVASPALQSASGLSSYSATANSRTDFGKGYLDITNGATNNYATVPQQSTPQVVAPFLYSHRPRTQFIGCSDEIIELVHKIFCEVTGRELSNVVITIGDEKVMRATMPNWHPGILGFARNANGLGVHEIFIKSDYLDSVILTIGHELGHVLSKSLSDIESEEAKAFAFEIAWIRAIKEHNFGNLANNIRLHEPAHNGIHNVALDFVFYHIRRGLAPLDIFDQLCAGNLRVSNLTFSL